MLKLLFLSFQKIFNIAFVNFSMLILLHHCLFWTILCCCCYYISCQCSNWIGLRAYLCCSNDQYSHDTVGLYRRTIHHHFPQRNLFVFSCSLLHSSISTSVHSNGLKLKGSQLSHVMGDVGYSSRFFHLYEIDHILFGCQILGAPSEICY